MTSPILPLGGRTVVMGIKEHRFDPLPCEISLEDLVPQDNFYRRLEAALDLSFDRRLLADKASPPVGFVGSEAGVGAKKREQSRLE